MTAITGMLTGTARGFGRASRVFLYLAIGTERLARFREGVEELWSDPWPAPAGAGALFPVERELFDRYIPPGSRVLVIGCGGGRDLIALATLGHTMTGVEPSPQAMDLCAIALREQGSRGDPGSRLLRRRARDRPVRRDRVLVFLLQLHSESARRIACLRKAAGLLAPRGRVFVSYVTMGGPHPMLPRLARLSAALTGSDWRVEDGDAVSLRREGMSRPCFFLEHVFTGLGLLEELAAAGMEVVHHRTAADYPWVICAAT